jgi:hypothetical protein
VHRSQLAEFGAHLVGVGQPKPVEDGQRLLPRRTGGAVHAGERVQTAVGVAELDGQGRQGESGMGGGAGGYDAQRQRQPRTLADDVVDRVRFGRYPAWAEVPAQQLPRFGSGEQVQAEQMCTLDGGQAGQPVAAGDDGEATGRARQERTDLVDVARVLSSTTSTRRPASRLR